MNAIERLSFRQSPFYDRKFLTNPLIVHRALCCVNGIMIAQILLDGADI